MSKYVPGTHNSVSDLSGFKFKRSEMRLTWNNLLVHKSEYDPKHPQLEIKVRGDNPSVKDQTRTQDTPTELEAPYDFTKGF